MESVVLYYGRDCIGELDYVISATTFASPIWNIQAMFARQLIDMIKIVYFIARIYMVSSFQICIRYQSSVILQFKTRVFLPRVIYIKCPSKPPRSSLPISSQHVLQITELPNLPPLFLPQSNLII